jgi:ABC-type Mn2+/Zn2+ transport system ATPase subunit
MSLKNTASKLKKVLERYRFAASRVRVERKSLKKASRELKNALLAREIVQHVAQAIEQQIHTRLAGLVSRCLAAVFENPYTFKIVFDRKRGKTEARMTFVRGELEADPRSMSGGSVLHVAAFGCRLASLLLAKPRRRTLLLLDEPAFMKSLANDNAARMKALIESLAAEMKVQIIMVSHDPRLCLAR